MNVQLHTPSAGGVIIKNNEVLLIFSANRNTYEFPKGTIENGELSEVAAVREVKEETGYDAVIVSFLNESTFEFDAKDGTRFSKTVTYYLMSLLNKDEPVPNLQAGEDFINVWTPVEEALELLSYDNLKDILLQAVAFNPQ